MQKELKQLNQHQTWLPQIILRKELPSETQVVALTWVFKIKCCPNGTLQKFKAWLCFRDNLDNSLVILGSYDSLKNNYNVTLNEKTVSFTEKVNGWVSRKSFLPENGLCYSNSYYTFKLGEIWMHGESLTRNNFYGDQYSSTITTIFNNEPSSVKSFKTIGYEGTSGWIASKITTDKESILTRPNPNLRFHR